MRADRLLSLLLLLQNRGRMTAAELAEELECSERTVYRDAESLSAAGVPIYAERGTGGGYRLMEGYRTRLTGLTEGQAHSLAFTGMPGPAGDLGLGSDLALARLKLSAAMPDTLRERAERVAARFHLDTTAWWRRPAATPFLAPLAEAVWESRTVRVSYRRFDDTRVERALDPLGLVLKGDTWYVVARPAPEPGGAEKPPRTYRVERIGALEDTGRPFTRPEGFDLPAAWRAWAEEFESSRFTLHTRVLLTDQGAELVPVLCSPRTAAQAEYGPVRADGRREARLTTESVPVAVHEFSRFGPHIEVLDPPELRRAMARHLEEAAALYRGGCGD
ncbi:helix-turn-helix transcriptional regulator [Nocardiopsis suaedae]|uniref:YafY family protein n=1 Tax=Nocardiopsis suaedae TaxID=3018444 RepID=A0ABT4TGN3_9ACTN|nr:YafY family protein [Nocardiopsis suaedae]MDA2803875.1 YafY family protein [Nocardiopsis suaedae]